MDTRDVRSHDVGPGAVGVQTTADSVEVVHAAECPTPTLGRTPHAAVLQSLNPQGPLPLHYTANVAPRQRHC